MSNSIAPRNLPGKQEALPQACLDPDNSASDAYRLAYDAGSMSPAAVHDEASCLIAHPKVAFRIRELRDQVTTGEAWSFERSMEEVETDISMAREQGQTSAAVRGTEQAMKLSGLLTYPPKDVPIQITQVTVVLNRGKEDT